MRLLAIVAAAVLGLSGCLGAGVARTARVLPVGGDEGQLALEVFPAIHRCEEDTCGTYRWVPVPTYGHRFGVAERLELGFRVGPLVAGEATVALLRSRHLHAALAPAAGVAVDGLGASPRAFGELAAVVELRLADGLGLVLHGGGRATHELSLGGLEPEPAAIGGAGADVRVAEGVRLAPSVGVVALDTPLGLRASPVLGLAVAFGDERAYPPGAAHSSSP